MLPVIRNSRNNNLSLVDDLFDTFIRTWDDRQELSSYYYDEQTKDHVITVQAPGFKKDDIEIEVDNRGISIKGEIKDEKTKGRLRRNTFHYAMTHYGIDSKTVDASLEDGILTIKFKNEKDKLSKKIEIK
ncbi:MAG: Hsp20/alpha crystallin family protein [Candidatus Methanofastidiosa archaeon]|nr:Hsp20/alpha crystallin family protein [Candidatus Methanofastidiosa archaeon]